MAEGKLNTSIQSQAASAAAAKPTGVLSAESLMAGTPGLQTTKPTMDISGLTSQRTELPARKKLSQTVFKEPEPSLANKPKTLTEEIFGQSVGANIDGYSRLTNKY